MDKRIRFITHRNKQILLVDLSKCSASEAESIARAVPDYVTAQPLASVLLLADFTGATIDGEALMAMKESAVFHKPHMKKSAWVGTESFPQNFYEDIRKFSRRELPTFKTREEALEWLVAD